MEYCRSLLSKHILIGIDSSSVAFKRKKDRMSPKCNRMQNSVMQYIKKMQNSVIQYRKNAKNTKEHQKLLILAIITKELLYR